MVKKKEKNLGSYEENKFIFSSIDKILAFSSNFWRKTGNFITEKCLPSKDSLLDGFLLIFKYVGLFFFYAGLVFLMGFIFYIYLLLMMGAFLLLLGWKMLKLFKKIFEEIGKND